VPAGNGRTSFSSTRATSARRPPSRWRRTATSAPPTRSPGARPSPIPTAPGSSARPAGTRSCTPTPAAGSSPGTWPRRASLPTTSA
jgi:hypothetical protein